MSQLKIINSDSLALKLLVSILVLVLVTLLSVVAVYGITKIFFGVISTIFIILLSVLFWEKALLYIFLWTVISGAFRKWVFPGQTDIVFFFSQLMITGIYIGFLLKNLKSGKTIPSNETGSIKFMNFIHMVFFIWCALTSFFQLDNILILIIGLILYFYNVPISYILPNLKISYNDINLFFKKIIILSLPILILGFIQYFSPASSPINKYSSKDIESIAFVGTHPRITGTFSYISGYATFLDLLILVILYLITINVNNKPYKFFLYTMLTLSFLSLCMNGSRGALLYALISVFIYFIFLFSVNIKVFKKLLLEFSILGITVLALSFSSSSLSESLYLPIYERFIENKDIGGRLQHTVFDALEFTKFSGLSGFGIGGTYQGTLSFSKKALMLSQLSGGYEEEPERIVLEVGIIGFILAYFIRFLIIYNFFILFIKLRNPGLRLLSAICIIFQLKYLFGIAYLFFDNTSSIFFWLLSSFLYILPKLDLNKKKEHLNN